MSPIKLIILNQGVKYICIKNSQNTIIKNLTTGVQKSNDASNKRLQ